jgi:pimeloyl-ACP methyl ester carboxylesterase
VRAGDRLLAAAALLAVAVALWQLWSASAGLTVERVRLGTVPATAYRPASDGPAPVVVIAHGFAGSQQLMQPFAVTLARNGYLAVTFDFPGHGRNPAPLTGGLAEEGARTRTLLEALDAVVAYARGLPGSDGRLALLGHSMASDVVVRYARAHPEIRATVAVSLFRPDVTADSPRNLLVIDGALEPAMLKEEGLRVVGMAAAGGGPAEEGVTYGSFADGTARRLALADGVEHIGVLYDRESMAEALGWMDAAFGRQGGAGFLDARGPWLGLLLLGIVVLTRPLSRLLPRVTPEPAGAGLPWRWLLPVAVVPALATQLVLRWLPTEFLPILLGDYLTSHFALYGLLTAAGLALVGGWRGFGRSVREAPGPLLAAAAAVTAYVVLAVALPVDRFATSYLPTPERAPLVLAVLCGTLPYFVTDEWLTRGAAAPRGAYAATKLLFALSLALAVAMDLRRLFFLIIIVPAILVFFVVYGLFSRWAYRRTGHPLVGAVANAVAFAWAVAVTFPLVGR